MKRAADDGAGAPAMTDVLVLSQSCLVAVNRVPYRILAEMGWAVRLAVPARYENGGFARDGEPAVAGDPPIEYLPLVGTHPRLWTFGGVRELLAARRPRIVVLDVDPGSRLAIQVGRAQRRHGGRTVCISCDNMPRTVLGDLRREGLAAGGRVAMARLLARLARPYVDHVFALSSDIRRVMGMVGFGNRSSVMPLGFDTRLFRPDEAARREVRQRLGLTETTIAYFGRMIPEKGVHLLIEALARMSDQPWQLLLDEFRDYTHPYVKHIRDRIEELGLAERVVYFDARHAEMGRYMNAADVVVAPSVSNPRWTEQYGRVVPEAMACGRMVITTTCGALPELIGDAGLVVPDGDVPALEGAIRRAVGDPALRAAYGARARERALASLSATRQAERMHEVFAGWIRPADGPRAAGAT